MRWTVFMILSLAFIDAVSASKFLAGVGLSSHLESRVNQESLETHTTKDFFVGYKFLDSWESKINVSTFSSESGNLTLKSKRSAVSVFLWIKKSMPLYFDSLKLMGGLGVGVQREKIQWSLYDQSLTKSGQLDPQWGGTLGIKNIWNWGGLYSDLEGQWILPVEDNQNPIFKFGLALGMAF